MSKSPVESIHLCLEIKGAGSQCQGCRVPSENCRIMRNILNNEVIYSDKTERSLKGLQESDIQDVISEIIKAVMKMNYSGNTDAQFAEWVRKIIRNKRADYFRKRYSIKKISESDPDKTKDFADTDTTATEDTDDREEKQSDISNTAILNNLPDLKQQEDFDKIEKKYDINNFLEKLKEKVTDGEMTGTDINFILAFYDGLKKGLRQEEIAGEMGITPNTFNQKLIRLREKLRKKGISFGP